MRRLLRVRAIVGILLVAAAAGISAGLFSTDIERGEADALLTGDTSKWVEVDGLPVHYKEQGTGPALLLLHNTGMWHGVWDDWVPLLAGRFRVISPDLPGFGATGPTAAEDYSMETLTDFVGGFLDALSLSEAHIAGLSLGGQLAWRWALDHPERVSSLVLLNPTGYPSREVPAVFKLARSWAGGVIRLMGTRFILERNLSSLWGTRAGIPADFVDRLLVSQRRAGNRDALLKFMRTDNPTRHTEIPSLRAPIQVQWSEMIGPQEFSVDLPHAEMIYYDDLGHFPNIEAPKESAGHALDFLLRQSR